MRKWKEETFPQIQAQAKKEGAAIFFADEASVRTNYHAGTTWAPVGKTPVVSGTGKTRSISMVSAVSPRGELHFQIHETGIKKEEFLEFCKMLIADMGRPVFLILDNSQVHRAKILKEYVEQTGGMLTVFFLPPYSPDLNPDEMSLSQCELRRSSLAWLPGSLSFEVLVVLLSSVQRRRLW